MRREVLEAYLQSTKIHETFSQDGLCVPRHPFAGTASPSQGIPQITGGKDIGKDNQRGPGQMDQVRTSRCEMGRMMYLILGIRRQTFRARVRPQCHR